MCGLTGKKPECRMKIACRDRGNHSSRERDQSRYQGNAGDQENIEPFNACPPYMHIINYLRVDVISTMKNRPVKFIRLCSFTILLFGTIVFPQDNNTGTEIPDKLFVIAKKTIVHQLTTGEQKSFTHIECTDHDRGIFVRLINNRRERGCIGFVKGVASLEQGVQAAALNAAFFDQRYKPITGKEINDLTIEITLIGQLEQIREYNNFIPGKHTIYIIGTYGKAVMQAQIATEKGWDRENFLRAICRKARIDESSYKNPKTKIYRADTVFKRKRFGEINSEK